MHQAGSTGLGGVNAAARPACGFNWVRQDAWVRSTMLPCDYHGCHAATTDVKVPVTVHARRHAPRCPLISSGPDRWGHTATLAPLWGTLYSRHQCQGRSSTII